MKKIIISAIILSTFFINSNVNASEFIDIQNHWAKEAIENSIKNNIVNGFADKTFKPDNNITVAEYLKVLVTSGKFILVKEGNNLWPDYYISTARENKIIIDGEFEDYNKNITRNEIARLTARFVDVENTKPSRNIFKDLDKDYEKDILKLHKLGIINGYEDKTFRGNNDVTRAEAIVIAQRATAQRRKISNEKKYDIKKEINLTNVKSDIKTKGFLKETRYEFNKGDLLIYDNGRYSTLQGYQVDNKNININKVHKIMQTLVNRDGYTSLCYIPIKDMINKLVITYGENESQIHYGNVNFAITYYEDKPYELRKISMKEEFSEECYMKIEVIKLWNDITDYDAGNFVDEYKKEKLFKCLEIEFGHRRAKEMLDYMVDKNVERVCGNSAELNQAEVKVFGNYIVNYYKNIGDVPQFYIALK